MKLVRARRSRRARIEIIPMIDVMFFLLASYLIASLSMQRIDALHVALPAGAASPMQPPSSAQTLTLSVDAHDRIALNGQEMTLDAIRGAVHARLPADGKLIVAADDKATQGMVTRAMLEARHAGARELMIVVRHE